MRALVFVAAAFSLAACGSGSSSGGAAAPPPASPSPEPSGNPTTAQPTTPNPTSPTPAPPTPPPPSTPTPAPPQPDRFVDVERIDSDAECDALVPASVPAPVAATMAASQNGGGCGRGLSEGTGHVAVISGFSSRGTQWQVFGPDGHAEQSFSITSDLWPQPEGWQGGQAAASGASISVTLLTLFADGSPRRSEQPQAAGFAPRSWFVAPDPQGGIALGWLGPTGGQDPTCVGEVRRYDASGAPAATAGRTGCFVGAVGVSTGGETLVLEPAAASTATVRWLSADGTLASAPSKDGFSSAFGQLLPLLDGSLVLLQGNTYVRSYPHLAAASEAPPAWLAARTGQTFRFTRGNRGYAFFPSSGDHSADCTQVVELVAPSGRRCVKLTFRRDGNACVTGSIDQGWDGTVVQQNDIGACGWRFWPRLLAGG